MHSFSGRNFSFLIAFAIVISLFVSTSEAVQLKESSPDPVKQLNKNEWNIPSSFKAVNDEQACIDWSEKLEKAIAAQDTKAFQSLVNFGFLVDRSVSGIEHEAYVRGFSRGTKDSISNFSLQLSGEGKSYRYLGLKKNELNDIGPIFRLLTEDGAANFHHYYLLKDRDGKVFGIDLKVLASGENISDTMRRLAIFNAPQSVSFLDRITGGNKDYSKENKQGVQFMQLCSQGSPENAIKAFQKLPERIKNEKAISLINVMTAVKASEDAYLEAVKDFKKRFPKDAAIDFVCLDLYLRAENYDALFPAIDRLQYQVGVEAHFTYYQGAAYAQQKKYDEAVRYYNKAIEIEPEFENAYWGLNQIYVGKRDFKSARDTLKKLIDTFGPMEFDFSDPEFVEFAKSPEHDELLKYNESKK